MQPASVGHGDEYWALWCEEYVRDAEENGALGVNIRMAQRHGKSVRGIGTMIYRMRERGFIVHYEARNATPRLTKKSQDLVDRYHRLKESRVSFVVEVTVNTKVEALAEMWDVIQQLEHWDERTGEPFQYKPARMRTLGERDVDGPGEDEGRPPAGDDPDHQQAEEDGQVVQGEGWPGARH